MRQVSGKPGQDAPHGQPPHDRSPWLTKRFGETLALAGVASRPPPARSSGYSVRTAPARPRPCASSPPWPFPTGAGPRWPATTWSATRAEVRRCIGVTAQDATLDDALTGRQNLVMVGELSDLRRSQAKARAVELLDRFGLTDAADRVIKGYSGGMRRRLDLAAGLVTRPPVLFLDEPTTGLDPASRAGMWADHPRAGCRRGDPAAHDPVPRGGRPARRPDRRHRPRAGHRRRHAGGAEGGNRGDPPARHAHRPASRSRERTARPWWTERCRSARTAVTWKPPCAPDPAWPRRWSGRSTTPACWSTTWRCGHRRSTMCSSPSPVGRLQTSVPSAPTCSWKRSRHDRAWSRSRRHPAARG